MYYSASSKTTSKLLNKLAFTPSSIFSTPSPSPPPFTSNIPTTLPTIPAPVKEPAPNGSDVRLPQTGSYRCLHEIP